MLRTIEKVVENVESGRMSRRAAVARLVGLAAALASPTSAPLLAELKPSSTFVSTGLNHIALKARELPRSRDFYREHLGLSVIRESEQNCFMACGSNNFLALFRADQPGLDHFAFTVSDYEAGDALERAKAAGLDGRRRENRVYFDDVDGNTVQVSGHWGDYPGGRPSGT